MKKILYGIFLSVFCLLAVGCAGEKQEEKTDSEYQLYYVSEEKSRVVNTECVLESTGTEDMVTEMCTQVFEKLQEEKGTALLPDGVNLINTKLSEDVLWLNFNQAYTGIDKTEEVLIRASLARTFTQIPGVSCVGFQVEGERLKDSYGKDVELMNADSFVENSGSEINAYQSVTMKLYFANESGDRLLEENRSVYYSTSMPLERVIVEQLLKGPKEQGHIATIPPETRILGVTVADGVCYVNLSKAYLDMAPNMLAEIPVYSIVNSLTRTGNVKQVQISITGDTKVKYLDSISLDQFFVQDMSLVEDTDE
ncbi:GerMN domain-containing protein [Ruminococcus sp. OA3]|uniref:GerMN domain-containing protein n=1 Tax=Ruminococcus sp. OA3 TaxID=2914164 RepID=UPI001F0531A4|nr:GerMN domain-containing protein [Ruminococcus sp. OA3]MCH1982132.1 GerMN domain-containing protein [Ruminococcus sp. OA3]